MKDRRACPIWSWFVRFGNVGVDRLGRYTILKHLASGGMADVLLGRSDGIEGFERHVVLKRIRPELAKDQRFIQMFLDEARLAATLHHQNVVQVHDIGEEHGEYFFAMEYLHGEDLRRILSTVSKQKAQVPLGHVVTIISAAAAGLHYAHDRRGTDKKRLEIVHRDVSPSNIILGYDGSVKLVDFGIAKATMRSSDTRTGTLKGKTSYMSPEQCKGESNLDRRSDVYSLGVVLYELATTTRLFKGDSDYLVMDAIVNGKVPLPQVRRADLPSELSTIIMHALAADPARRYQTADELRLALDQFALDYGLASSTSSLSAYLRKLFGDKPEPWLDTAQFEKGGSSPPSRPSWSEPEGRGSSEELATSLNGPPTTAGRKSGAHAALRDRPSSSSPPLTKRPSATQLGFVTSRNTALPTTRTSMRMAWEQQPVEPPVERIGMRGSTKAMLVAAPVVLAVAAIAGWHFLQLEEPSPTAVAATRALPPNQPAPRPVISPIDPVDATVPEVAERATSGAKPAPDSRSNLRATPSHVATPRVRTRPSAPRSHAAIAQAAPAPAPVVAALPPRPAPAPAVVAPVPPPVPAAPAPPPAPAPTLPPAAAPAPSTTAPPPATGSAAPAVAAPPPTVEIARLSTATVSMVARDHAAQLAKCEGANSLHGDLAISFEIDARGRVSRSQVSSTIKNIKVVSCVLTALRSWQFPKPPTGAAKGVYTITYQ